MNDRIPILRLNVRGNRHVVECLDRPYDFWYVVKTFGSTNDALLGRLSFGFKLILTITEK